MTDKQVTDSMMIEAYTAYHKANIEGKINPMRAALEAVFASIPDNTQVIKDFVDMMERDQAKIHAMWFHITPEYRALKAIILPVGEDNAQIK